MPLILLKNSTTAEIPSGQTLNYCIAVSNGLNTFSTPHEDAANYIEGLYSPPAISLDRVQLEPIKRFFPRTSVVYILSDCRRDCSHAVSDVNYVFCRSSGDRAARSAPGLLPKSSLTIRRSRRTALFFCRYVPVLLKTNNIFTSRQSSRNTVDSPVFSKSFVKFGVRTC